MTELLRTHLYDEHVKLNAKIVPFAGWEMPVQYTSVKEEVLAVRNHVGIFDVSHMGEFFVEGEDAENFVDYLVTNDVLSAPTGKAIYSPLCRDDGTVIDDLIVYKLSPGKILICVNASNVEKDFNWMQSKLSSYKCTLTNKSNDYSLVAIQGPKSWEILKDLILDLPELEYYSVTEIYYKSTPIIIARTGYTGEDGFEIFASHICIKELWNTLINKKVVPCGLASRDVLRLEVAYPLYGHELNDELNPFDAGLGWTVRHLKPNFLGKEALNNKKPKKFKLVKLELEKGIPREGYNVLNEQGEIIGHIASGTMSVVLNRGIATALIDVNKIPANDSFYIDIRQKLYQAFLVKKPFVTGGHK